MNAGKVKYDAIEIPAGLEDAIDSGIKRAGRQRPMRALRRTAAGAAAAVCVLFAGANIMPVYSFAADLPVLGSIVRVLHVGSGGEVTDGAQAAPTPTAAPWSSPLRAPTGRWTPCRTTR